MKVLLVAEKDDFKNLLSYHLKPIGFEIVHYRDPVKALDNLEELNPDMILFHSGDFPRHWKPLLKLLRESKSKEEVVFILITGEKMDVDEATKATHLGVNGFVKENFSDKEEIYRLQDLFKRYKSISDKRKFHRFIPAEYDKLEMLFTHPRRAVLVTGSIAEISIQGATFVPDISSLTEDVKVGETISHCSLLAGENLIHVDCTVMRNRGDLGLKFKSFEAGGHHKLFQYIQERPERELKAALGRE